ncbi:MAG: TIGR01212 family radical SAM protein [Bacillota bacterium]|nr:TIGR01212 family radical SAM protein [Bacillota bacterium]
MERYYSLNTYFKNKYGQKIGKLSLDGGFSCPNRDGSLSTGGCIFCSEKGAGEFSSAGNILDQIADQKIRLQKKWKVNKFIGYFQNFTNTYGPINKLKSLYYQVLEDPDIVGLAIATRADCLDEQVLDLLEDLAKTTDLWLEIGMQSVKAQTIAYINRGYSHDYLKTKLEELKKRNIKFVLHVIFGLPGESEEDMLKSIAFVNESGAFGIKIHSLYIQTDSRLYQAYLEENFPLLSKDQYTDLVVKALTLLNKDLVVHRITGDGDKKKLVAPLWAADKLAVIGLINKKLKVLDEKKP